MRNILSKYSFFLICFLIFINQKIHAQPNILENNKALIEKLAKFHFIHEIDSNFIQYQTKESASINYGYGVANKKTGEIIFPAQKEISGFIKSYGKYIAICQLNNLGKEVFGLINDTGKIILNFEYDRIGSVFVPLPDSLLTVQMGNKFGVFNTNTQILSPIVYNNTSNALNDGYAYHEGGASQADEIVYSQLGWLNGYRAKQSLVEDREPKAKIILKGDLAYLVNKKGEKISKDYDYDMAYFHRSQPSEFYTGAVKDTGNTNPDARKLFLINSDGKEITEISKATNDADRHFIELDRYKSYYFIETNKTVTIPNGYYRLVYCYSKEGFLGFRNTKTDQKLFIDKYGNQIIVGLPLQPKTIIITPKLSEAEIEKFKKLATVNHRLGRVIKYQYNEKGKVFKETGFDFDYIPLPELSWENTFYYNKVDSVTKVTRYTGGDEVYDLSDDNEHGKTSKTYNTKKQVVKTVFSSDNYKYEEHFVYDKFGRLVERTEITNGNVGGKMLFKYDEKGRLIVENLYRDKQLAYTYKTSYDAKSRKIKYDMINAKGTKSGIWLYEYNDKNQLLYKIDLYNLTDDKKSVEATEGAPTLQPAPKKQN